MNLIFSIAVTVFFNLQYNYDSTKLEYHISKPMEELVRIEFLTKELTSDSNSVFACYLTNYYDTTHFLFVTFNKSDQEMFEIAQASNRIIVIDGINIPIIFASDFKFTTTFNPSMNETEYYEIHPLLGGFRIIVIGRYTQAKILTYYWDR